MGWEKIKISKTQSDTDNYQNAWRKCLYICFIVYGNQLSNSKKLWKKMDLETAPQDDAFQVRYSNNDLFMLNLL